MPSQAERVMGLLRGFAGAHGTYDVEEFSQGKQKQEIKKSARTLRRPVTAQLWERHLAGDYHLGVITITEESNCWWGAVDIDDYTIQHGDLVQRLGQIPLPALVCRTKSGGAHVYLFFSEPIPASDVMPRLRELSALLGYGGCEVFPKQTSISTEQEGLGNWLNMPYYNHLDPDSRTYACKPDGRGMSLEQFLRTAESSRLTRQQLMSLSLRSDTRGWEDAPPCLEHLAGLPGGIGQGIQNNALFGFAVLAKKMEPERWQDLLGEWNRELFSPPHDRMDGIVKSHEKKDYNYKCHDAPCVSHCNMPLCRQRKFGIGPGEGVDIVESVSILVTEPPLFFVVLKTGGTVECSGEELLSPRLFQGLVMNQLLTTIPLYRQETWVRQVQRAVEGATRIEAPAEVGTTGQLHELMERFCTDRHAADRVEEILLGKPWRDDGEDVVWFRLRDLQEFLDRSKFSKLRRSQVTERIKKMGGRSHFFNLAGRGVNVWGLPIGSLSWTNGEIHTPPEQESPL